MKKLSILIPSLITRNHLLSALLTDLEFQLTPEVEVIVLIDDRHHESTGEKRNRLLQMARGTYSVFIDDDDRIRETYVKDIVEAMKFEPDCITFNVHRMENWQTVGEQIVSLEHPAGWSIENGGTEFITYRCSPLHITPIKTDIAKEIKFPPYSVQEDTPWQKAIYPHLKTQVRINKVLYDYLYVSPDQRNDTHDLGGWKLVTKELDD